MAEPIVLPSRLSFLYSLGDSKEIGARGVSPLAPNSRIMLRRTGDCSASAVAHRAEARAFAAQPDLAAVEGGGRGQAHRAEARAFAAQPHLAAVEGGGRGQAHRAEARAFAAQPHLAAVEGGGRGQAHRAEARAFAAQPDLAAVEVLPGPAAPGRSSGFRRPAAPCRIRSICD